MKDSIIDSAQQLTFHKQSCPVCMVSLALCAEGSMLESEFQEALLETGTHAERSEYDA
jgi:hypothetical protein